MKKEILIKLVSVIVLLGLVVVLSGCDMKKEDDNNKITISEENTNLSVSEEEILDDGSIKSLVKLNEINVGDIVNYNAGDTEDGEEYTYAVKEELTGRKPFEGLATFSSNDKMSWKVLNVDSKSGTIELMAADNTKSITFDKQTGFLNSEKVLQDASDVYGHGKGAVSARSINVEDVNKYSGFDQIDKTKYAPDAFKYGTVKEYTSGDFIKQIKDSDGNVIGYEDSVETASEDNPIEMTETEYGYVILDEKGETEDDFYYAISDFYGNKEQNMFVVDTNGKLRGYWLATRMAHNYNIKGIERCEFGLMRVSLKQVTFSVLCSSTNGNHGGYGAYLCPVVKLDSEIKLEKNENGEWDLIVK